MAAAGHAYAALRHAAEPSVIRENMNRHLKKIIISLLCIPVLVALFAVYSVIKHKQYNFTITVRSRPKGRPPDALVRAPLSFALAGIAPPEK